MPLRRGVYIAVTGPSYETPAEIRAFRALGADAVGDVHGAGGDCGLARGDEGTGLFADYEHGRGHPSGTTVGDEVIAVGERQSKVLVGLVRAVVEAL